MKNSVSKTLKEILKNKYFMYFMVFIYIVSVLKCIQNGKIKYVAVLLLITFIFSILTHNKTLILLLSLVLFHFLKSSGILSFQEGMTTTSDDAKTDNTTTTATTDKKKLVKDKELVSMGETHHEETAENTTTGGDDTTTVDTFKNVDSLEKAKMEGGSKKKESYIDLASTIEKSYENLNSMLGREGIKNLTSDTAELMKKQQDLFKSMEAMTPLIEKATNMLGDLNVGGLVKNMSSMIKPSKKESFCGCNL